MKKLFKITSVILAVAMLCMLFVVPASAQASGAAISLGLDAVVLPGETVTIPVRVENMQEAAALEFTVDLDGLEFKEFVAGTWDAAALEENVAVNAAGDVKVASYFSDYVGTLFSIVATVPANAESTVSVNGAFAVDYDESEITVAGDSVNVTAYAIAYDFMTLVMGETVDMKIYFTDNSADINLDLSVTVNELDENGEEKTTEYTAEKVGTGRYFVKVPRFSYEMKEEIVVNATYTANEQELYAAENMSLTVQDYFADAADKQLSSQWTQEAFDCLYAMAKYGEVAANYFSNSKVTYDAPVYENANVGYEGGDIHTSQAIDLSDVLTEPAADAIKTAVEVAVGENDEIVDAEYDVNLSDLRETLVLSSEICFKLYTEITFEEAAAYNFAYGTSLGALEAVSGDLIGSYDIDEETYVTIKVPVKAYQSGQTFYVKATKVADDTTVAIVKYTAPDNYIARTWDLSEEDAYAKNDITLRTMLSALEVYGNSANAYYAAQ